MDLVSQQQIAMMEKRQLFLRSYQFCRKRSLNEKIKGSLVKAKRVAWLKLCSARRLPLVVWSRLRCAFYFRRQLFVRLVNHNVAASSSCW